MKMTITEFWDKIDNVDDHVLTLEKAKTLKGKRIAWTYHGYEANPDHVYEMVVGDIVSRLDYEETQPVKGFKSRADYWRSYMSKKQLKEQKAILILLNHENKTTFVVCDTSDKGYFTEPTFTCSSADRAVTYIEL